MLIAGQSDLENELSAPSFYQDPYPVYQRLLEEEPVFWSERIGAWLISRYDDVGATIRDTTHFSNRGRFSGVLDRLPPEVRPEFKPLENHFSVGMIGSDPPDHGRLRGLINRAFTPRVIENLRPRVIEIVDDLLDDIGDRDSFDAIAEFAYPLPATVIAIMIGAPPEDRDRFKGWSDGILAFQGTGRTTPEVLGRSQRDLMEMREFLKDLMAKRRRDPQDDLLTRLVEAESAGDKLTEGELLATCVTLLTAGHETTTNLIGSGLLTLLRHPEQLEELRQNPAMMPAAIEEMLRFESPLQRNPRKVPADFEMHGKAIRRGDFVLQVLGAANRDPRQFPDPDRFDITRQPNRHVAFGMGIHFCLGAPLARLEAPIAIEAVLRRWPELKLAQDHVTWREHGLLRAQETLMLSR